MNADEFEKHFRDLRPRLHRYCARMTGSSIHGEDVVQDTFLKAFRARSDGIDVNNLEGWLFRIAHNASLDFVRGHLRNTVVPLTEDIEAEALPDVDMVAVGVQTFLRLPELQRCAVILKDVLGHSFEEIANIAGCSPTAARSALQRGRASLRRLAEASNDARVPLMSDQDRRKIAAFVDLFRAGDFDAIRVMLADDVKVQLVNRLQLEGRDKVVPYFTRYAAESKWHFVFGAIEGLPAMLVFDATSPSQTPAHFVLVGWKDNMIAEIRDFLFAPYLLEATDWVRLA
jgi:RNA polymerase sigma-70 factor (ECF subfamily)